MPKTQANPDRKSEPLTAARVETTSRVAGPVLLTPCAPASGSQMAETRGGSLTFGWRADANAIGDLYPRERLRTDFCLKVAGDSRGFFIMKSVTGDTFSVTLSYEEIRFKLGPAFDRGENAHVQWHVCLSLATGGPLFVSSRSDLTLVAQGNALRAPQPGGKSVHRRLFALVILATALFA